MAECLSWLLCQLVYQFIYINPRKAVLLSILLCNVWYEHIIGHNMARIIISLSSLCRVTLVYAVECVYMFTLNFLNCLLCHIWGCVFSICPFLFFMILRLFVSYYILSHVSPFLEIWITSHCLGLFGSETMICAVSCYVFGWYLYAFLYAISCYMDRVMKTYKRPYL